jgi:hypothetical protein
VLGQHVGRASQEWCGDDAYEFWVTVPSERKDDVLLAPVEKLHAGIPSAVDDLRNTWNHGESAYSSQPGFGAGAHEPLLGPS